MKNDTGKESLQLSPIDPLFYSQIFLGLVRQGKNQDPWQIAEEAQVSVLTQASGVQDATAFRARRRALILANGIINEKGDLDDKAIELWLNLLVQKGYVPYPEADADRMFIEHMRSTLQKLRDEKPLRDQIKKFQVPVCHKWAETILRKAVGLSDAKALETKHVRIAVLSCLFTYLRQAVGSCFATAPAILIQSEQVGNLLLDLEELLFTGRLKRTFGGIEYAVPLSPSVGPGDLKKNIVYLSDKGQILLSPAVHLYLETAGVLLPTDSFEERIQKSKELYGSLPSFSPADTLESFLQKGLLVHFGISEEELVAAKKAEEDLAKIRSRSTFVAHGRTVDARREKIIELIENEKKAKMAFVSFSDNVLLRAWEYTLASFSEVKMEFSQWNMYASLGLHPEEQGGIGKVIYQFFEKKISDSNEKLEEYQRDYEIAFDQLRATEALLKKASSESEARRLQAEFQSRLYHMQACLDLRDAFYKKASHYPRFYSFMTKQFEEKIPQYFQEIYDADMQDVDPSHYEDSPAGFRLVFKHGRSDASLWSLVTSPSQYVDVLVSFFTFAETQIIVDCEWEKTEDDIRDVISLVIGQIRTDEFLRTALDRMARAHKVAPSKKPIEKIEKKPWAYTSGGTLPTLIKTYYRKESEIREETFRLETVMDLLTHVLDALKTVSYPLQRSFEEAPNRRMLMHSPSHAFLLQPGWSPFFKGWEDTGFTYTWIRDLFVRPSQMFYASLSLSPSEQSFLLDLFVSLFPSDLAYRFGKAFEVKESPIGIDEFKSIHTQVLQALPKVGPFSRQEAEDKLDALLYESLPLIPASKWKASVYEILEAKVGTKLLSILEQFPDEPSEYMTSKLLKEIAKACFLLAAGSCHLSFDLHQYVMDKAQELKFSSPRPLFFADTNWPYYHFAFVVNPGSGNLELWRMTPSGYRGIKMSEWTNFFRPNAKEIWSIYINPDEYGMAHYRKPF